MQRLIGVAIACLILPLVNACEPVDTAERFRARQRKYDPLYLWSVEITSPQHSGPVTICADTFIREGFVRPLPNQDGKQCALQEPPIIDGERIKMYCTLNDRNYIVWATVKGDPKESFDLYYGISSEGSSMREVRRYRKLGPCPAGWEIGDNTDRRGNLRKNALH